MKYPNREQDFGSKQRKVGFGANGPVMPPKRTGYADGGAVFNNGQPLQPVPYMDVYGNLQKIDPLVAWNMGMYRGDGSATSSTVTPSLPPQAVSSSPLASVPYHEASVDSLRAKGAADLEALAAPARARFTAGNRGDTPAPAPAKAFAGGGAVGGGAGFELDPQGTVSSFAGVPVSQGRSMTPAPSAAPQLKPVERSRTPTVGKQRQRTGFAKGGTVQDAVGQDTFVTGDTTAGEVQDRFNQALATDDKTRRGYAGGGAVDEEAGLKKRIKASEEAAKYATEHNLTKFDTPPLMTETSSTSPTGVTTSQMTRNFEEGGYVDEGGDGGAAVAESERQRLIEEEQRRAAEAEAAADADRKAQAVAAERAAAEAKAPAAEQTGQAQETTPGAMPAQPEDIAPAQPTAAEALNQPAPAAQQVDPAQRPTGYQEQQPQQDDGFLGKVANYVHSMFDIGAQAAPAPSGPAQPPPPAPAAIGPEQPTGYDRTQQLKPLPEVPAPTARPPVAPTDPMGSLLHEGAKQVGDYISRQAGVSDPYNPARGGRSHLEDIWHGIKGSLSDMMQGAKGYPPEKIQEILHSDPWGSHGAAVQKTFDTYKNQNNMDELAKLYQGLRPVYDNMMGVSRAAFDNGNIDSGLRAIERAHDMLPNNADLKIARDGQGNFNFNLTPPGGGQPKSFTLTPQQMNSFMNSNASQYDHVAVNDIGKTLEQMMKSTGYQTSGPAVEEAQRRAYQPPPGEATPNGNAWAKPEAWQTPEDRQATIDRSAPAIPDIITGTKQNPIVTPQVPPEVAYGQQRPTQADDVPRPGPPGPPQYATDQGFPVRNGIVYPPGGIPYVAPKYNDAAHDPTQNTQGWQPWRDVSRAVPYSPAELAQQRERAVTPPEGRLASGAPVPMDEYPARGFPGAEQARVTAGGQPAPPQPGTGTGGTLTDREIATRAAGNPYGAAQQPSLPPREQRGGSNYAIPGRPGMVETPDGRTVSGADRAQELDDRAGREFQERQKQYFINRNPGLRAQTIMEDQRAGGRQQLETQRGETQRDIANTRAGAILTKADRDNQSRQEIASGRQDTEFMKEGGRNQRSDDREAGRDRRMEYAQGEMNRRADNVLQRRDENLAFLRSKAAAEIEQKYVQGDARNVMGTVRTKIAQGVKLNETEMEVYQQILDRAHATGEQSPNMNPDASRGPSMLDFARNPENRTTARGGTPTIDVSPGAAAALRANPSLQAQFDAKYGPGRARQILGGP